MSRSSKAASSGSEKKATMEELIKMAKKLESDLKTNCEKILKNQNPTKFEKEELRILMYESKLRFYSLAELELAKQKYDVTETFNTLVDWEHKLNKSIRDLSATYADQFYTYTHHADRLLNTVIKQIEEAQVKSADAAASSGPKNVTEASIEKGSNDFLSQAQDIAYLARAATSEDEKASYRSQVKLKEALTHLMNHYGSRTLSEGKNKTSSMFTSFTAAEKLKAVKEILKEIESAKKPAPSAYPNVEKAKHQGLLGELYQMLLATPEFKKRNTHENNDNKPPTSTASR